MPRVNKKDLLQILKEFREAHKVPVFLKKTIGGDYVLFWEDEGNNIHEDISPSLSVREMSLWIGGLRDGHRLGLRYG